MRPKQSRFRMPDPFATLILTRPRDASERFAESLSDVLKPGVRVIISPLFEIVPLGRIPDFSGIRGVIFTSANGVRHAGRGNGLPAYCVGPATWHAAAASGWDAQKSGATADELVDCLISTTPPVPLLHVGGVHRRGQVAERLSAAGLPTKEAIVYDQESRPLAPAALSALAGDSPVILPLFSPRTARRFAAVAQPRAPLHLVAISAAVMAETRGLSAASRSVASDPDSQSMRNTVANLLRRVEADHSPK